MIYRKFLQYMLLTCVIVLSFYLTSCDFNDNNDSTTSSKEIYINETGSWSNGVEFSIYNHKETSELDFGLYKYTTNDKFLVIGLRVYNGSTETFTADGTDVWLLFNDTQIYQQNIVERHAQGYNDISQSPTVTKEYFLFFEIGKNILMNDLKLVINNGGFWDSESIIIKLENAPKDSTVNLDYAYDNKIENYNFYSSTSITPSNFPIPKRENYEFLGWYFNADYSGEKLENHTLTPNQNLTLFAKWEKKIYINYNYQYENKKESVLIGENNDYTLTIPSRTGYTFGGWFLNNEYTGNSITTVSNLKNDVDVFAKWIGNPVRIIFDGNGATSGEMESQSFFVGENKSLNENRYVKEGYIFSGWTLNSNDTVVYDNKFDFTMIPTDDETITFYAKWTPRTDIPYTVNHYLQNVYDEEYTLKLSISQTGIADSVVSPAVNQYDGFSSPNVKTVTIAVDGSLTVDYYYPRNNYTLMFVANGGASSFDTIVQKYETEFELPTVERTGYTFGGWFTDITLVEPLNISTIPCENISVYAWWKEENKPTEFTYDGIDSLAIKTYVGESTTIHVPSYIGGICVKEISSYAFYNKNTVTKIIVSDSVISIGRSAFEGMTSLEEITLPFVGATANETDGRTKVLGYIFGYRDYDSATYKTSQGKETYQYFHSAPVGQTYTRCYKIPQSLKKVTITNQTDIPANAFMNCDLLEEIILPNNITSIGEYAFYECQKISLLNISDNVVSIGKVAFYNCINLSQLNSVEVGTFNLPSSLTTIGDSAFYHCSKISNIFCGDKISQIGAAAFSDCSAIKRFNSDVDGELIIPKSLLNVNRDTFRNNSSIIKVVVHENVESIGTSAFEGMTSLEEITLPFVGATANETDGRTKVLGYIFGYRDYDSATYKTSQGKETYQYFHSAPVGQTYTRCYKIPQSLKKVTITNQTDIPANAFMNCDLLEEIILPESIISIEKQAFYMCSNIVTIDIGNSIIKIDELAFMGCGKLEEIRIPISVITINQQAFRDCTSLMIKYDGDSIPSTWDTNWNYSNCIIVTGEPKEQNA